MPVSIKRPPVNELLNNAVAQQEKLLETKVEILSRPANIWSKDYKSKRLTIKLAASAPMIAARSGRGTRSRPTSGHNSRGVNVSSSMDTSDHGSNSTTKRQSMSLPKIKWRQVRSFSQFVGLFLSEESAEELDLFLYKATIAVSLMCERMLWYRSVRVINIAMWPMAFTVLAIQSPQLDYTINNGVDMNVYILDVIINTWFLVHSFMRVLGLYMRIKVEKAYQREVHALDAFTSSGILQLVATCMCFGYGLNTVGLWVRVTRLALTTPTVLGVFPHINVLLSGLNAGLRSISFTLLVFFLIIMTYASLGHYLFAANDPFHFGTYALSALTFFQLSTFENWSTILYINYGGCDSFGLSEYPPTAGFANQTVTVHTGWGDFNIPNCVDPRARPFASSVVFMSFVIIGGLVIVSMCLAAVAIGVNERLIALRRLSVYGGGGDGPGAERSLRHAKGAEGGAKASKLFGNTKEKAIMKTLLQKSWSEAPGTLSEIRTSSGKLLRGRSTPKLTLVNGGNDEAEREDMANVVWLHTVLSSPFYVAAVSGLITADAVIQIYEEGKEYNGATYAMHVFIQVLLTLDYLVRLYDAGAEKRLHFVRGFWNCFDICMSAILLATLGLTRYAWLRSLRIFRLIRVLKLYSNVFGDLLVIIKSVANSFICVVYVLAILTTVFLLFAVAGTLLFKEANPYYFGDVVSTLKTLLQVMTQDNWSTIMRTCMIGCRYFGSNTNTPLFDATCNHNVSGIGVGWWGATYFVVFMTLSSMVIANLMVGVIISSMELLREGYKEEQHVWENVRRIQTAYNLRAESVHRMLELWELLDKGANGFLTFEETQPVMELINIKAWKQFEIYMKADVDKNGSISFHEFCEFIVDLGNKKSLPEFIESPEAIAAAAAAAKKAKAAAASSKQNASMAARVNSVGGALSAMAGGERLSAKVKTPGSPKVDGGSTKVEIPNLRSSMDGAVLTDAAAGLTRGDDGASATGVASVDGNTHANMSSVDIHGLEGSVKVPYHSRSSLSPDPGAVVLDKTLSGTLVTSARMLVRRASSFLDVTSADGSGSAKEAPRKMSLLPEGEVELDDYVIGSGASASGGGPGGSDRSAYKDAWSVDTAEQKKKGSTVDAVSDFKGSSD